MSAKLPDSLAVSGAPLVGRRLCAPDVPFFGCFNGRAATPAFRPPYSHLQSEDHEALAQFVKRLTWTDMRACAVDDEEAYAIRDAVDRLGKALAEQGYAPR